MGKGIALEFKKRYPEMYSDYKVLCSTSKIDIGTLWLYRAKDRNILNFPTKKHWRQPSKPEYIEAGLEKFVSSYEHFCITSISFPLLGTGNGGLDWDDVVQPLMEKYLSSLPISIYIHIHHSAVEFIPEHLLPLPQAIPFDILIEDLRQLKGTTLYTLSENNPFIFLGIDNEVLRFIRNSNTYTIPVEHLRMFWGDLNSNKIVVSTDAPGRIAKEHALIFPLLAKTPYIQIINASKDDALLLKQPSRALMLAQVPTDKISERQLSLL